MSKLPKAPLLEVIFEVKWDILNNDDLVDFQYQHGDLYSKLKKNYSFRENLMPPEIPFEVLKGVPVYRFRKDKNSYPLIQIGPGLLSLNTTDDTYFWEKYKGEIDSLIKNFTDVYPKFSELKLVPVLTYIDFFEINENQNTIEFINKNLHINLQQSFIDDKKNNVQDINLIFNYSVGNDTLSLNLRNGNINNQKKGLVLQTTIIGEKGIYTIDNISTWLENSHEFSSEIFKNLTKGNLYNSFK